MKIKKVLKYFPISLMSGSLLLAACFAPSVALNNQNILHKLNKDATRENVDTIAITADNLVNWTWPNDVYAETQGYEYTDALTKTTNVFTIDKDGFSINFDYPSFSTGTERIDNKTAYHRQMSGSLIIDAFEYDRNRSEVKKSDNSIFEFMQFAHTAPVDKLTSITENIVLNAEQPFLSCQIPFVDLKMQQRYKIGDNCEFQNYAIERLGRDVFIQNSDKSKVYDGEFTRTQYGSYDPNCQLLDFSLVGVHYHGENALNESKLGIYNDYDIDGNYLNTYMQIQKEGVDIFESKLPELTVDDSKLNKRLTVLQQDLTVSDLVTLSNAEMIPSFGKQTVTATRDVAYGTITFNYKPEFIFQNAKLIKYEGLGISKTIDGFAGTRMTVKDTYPQVRVDKWLETITVDSKYSRTKIAEYFNLIDVPTDADFIITIESINYTTGVLVFKIQTTKITDGAGGSIDELSPEFPATLNLTERVTKMTPITSGYPGTLTVEELKDNLFDGNKVKNLELFNQFVNISTPAEDVEYFLIENSWNANGGNGIVTFKVYASQYYGIDGQLTNGSADKLQSVVTFNLKLKKSQSFIKEKTNYPKEVRVDKFIAYLTGMDSNFDPAILPDYFDMTNIPSTAVFSLEGTPEYSEWDANYTRDTITFDLKISEFNNASGITESKIQKVSFTLAPQRKTTDVTVKSVFNNPDRVDQFNTNIETLNGVDLKAYLANYLDFVSLPANAVVSATIADYDSYDGSVELNLNVKNYYDNNGNLNTNTKSFSGLPLILKSIPTVVEVIKPIDLNVRLDHFLKTFADETTGVVTNLNALQEYVKFDFWDANTSLKIDLASTVADNATGSWKANLILGEANNSESDRVIDEPFEIAFQFAPKFDPTTIKKLTEYPFIQLDDFKTTLFDENGFAKSTINDYLQIHSLPPDAKIKLIGEPVIDYPNAQLTMTVQATSFYDENSDLQTSITRPATPTLVETFTFNLLSPETTIVVVENYDQTPRVDRFADRIKDLTNDALKTALENYVNFDYLPANVDLSIDPSTFEIINIPGTLNFNIAASRYFDSAGYLKTTTKLFPITLNLANKYASTTISAKSVLPTEKIRVDRFITALGASEINPEITNLDVLNAYVDVVSLPENTTLSVDYTKPFNADPKTGILTFSINASQYYDDDSNLQTTGYSFPLVLNLTAMYDPTAITAKTSGIPDTRVDRFFKTFMDVNTNKVTNLSVLEQYVDIVSLPPAAQLYVTQTVVNTKSGTVSFNLIATQYYDDDSNLKTDSVQTNNRPFPISLQLAPKLDPTDFIAKTSLPNDVLVHELTAYITYAGEVDKQRLERYVNIISLPANTKINLEEISHSQTTGEIIYNIKVDKHYDANGDLQASAKTFNVVLNLDKVHNETKIYALSKYPTDLSVAEFKQAVESPDGNVMIQNLTKFVSIESLPTTSTLSIIWGIETATTVSFKIHASQYYDADHRLANDKDYAISLIFPNKPVETNIKAWDTYPTISVLQFFKTINPNDVIDYAQLAKYVDFASVPHDAELSISNQITSETTGTVTFDINTTEWYDRDLQYHNTSKAFTITLNLTPKYNKTNLFGYASIAKDLTTNQFWLLISTDGVLDHAKLSQYVTMDNLVPDTTIEYFNAVKNFNGSISFDLAVDRYYDEQGMENIGRKVFKITLTNLDQVSQQNTIVDLTWLYVVIALVGSIGIGLVWFLIARNRKSKQQ